MGTVIRPEITKKNRWYIDRHRYYELKHFCMQCPIWKKELSRLNEYARSNPASAPVLTEHRIVEDIAAKRMYFSARIDMLEKAAADTDPVLGKYILEGVVNGKSYDAINALHRVPACKDIYYDLYRKFFYILSELRL